MSILIRHQARDLEPTDGVLTRLRTRLQETQAREGRANADAAREARLSAARQARLAEADVVADLESAFDLPIPLPGEDPPVLVNLEESTPVPDDEVIGDVPLEDQFEDLDAARTACVIAGHDEEM